MQAKIQKWGNSLAVRILKTLATEAHLAQEAIVEIAVAKGKLIIAPIKRRKYNLEELVSRITDENIHKEDIWGPAVGRDGVVSRRRYVPDRRDVVWLMFGPQAGHEQSGRRPGVVMSSLIYNGKTGMALCCPITSHVKGYPFEVLVPAGLEISGTILADHIRNIDWKTRRAEYLCKLPDKALEEVTEKILSLLVK